MACACEFWPGAFLLPSRGVDVHNNPAYCLLLSVFIMHEGQNQLTITHYTLRIVHYALPETYPWCMHAKRKLNQSRGTRTVHRARDLSRARWISLSNPLFLFT